MAYDIIIVGARCAGSAVAMLLARKGYRVLLVDKTSFPSDTISTHYIQQPGVAKLKSWNLLDRVRASNCPPILKCTLDVGPFTLAGSAPPADGLAEAYCPRRVVLDKILADAAVEAGAEFREGFLVQELVADGDQIAGIRGRHKGESNVTEKTRIVIGADGMRSMVAATVRASEYNTKPALACYYYTYWSGLRWDAIDLSIRDSHYVGGFPTNDGLTCIFAGWRNDEFSVYRAAVEANYLSTLDAVPGLTERLRNGKREHRFMGTADLPNFFRKPYGPGWALVGDAGYHKDPFTGQGIANAFCDAERLAKAIDAGLSGARPLEEAMHGYEQQRNADVLPMYEYTCHLATLDPPSPDEQKLFAALRGNQPEIDRLFGAILAGTVRLDEFFAPDNVRRIVASAGLA
jgi:flavin-dependent dehydrogenase